MSDQSVDILIRTRAELQGAEQAADQMERNIGKAKALGQDTTALEEKLKTLKASLDAARQSLSEQAVEMGRVTEASAKYKQELAELEQQVKNLDAREAFVKNVAPEELAKGAERTERMKDATETFTMALDEEDDAQKELGKTVKQYTEKELEDLFGKTTKTVDIKKQLKEAVKGLSTQFPILGRAMMIGINPIAGAVAAAAAAFAIWRMRVNELNSTLSNVELPQIQPRDITQINEAAKAWKSYGDAVRDAFKEFRSSESLYNRATGNIDRQVEAQKRLLAANKALELSTATTPEARAAIESRYGAAEASLAEHAEKQKLARLVEEKANLEISARTKLAEAERIKPGFGGATAQDEDALRAEAETSNKEIQERRQKLNDLRSYKSRDGGLGFFESMAVKKRIITSGMSVDELIAADEDAIGRAQPNVDRYNSFLRAKALNERRAKLIESAGQDQAKATGIGLQLPGEIAATQQGIQVNRQVAGIENQTRSNQLAGELSKESKEIRGQQDQLLQESVAAIQSGNRVSEATLKLLREQSTRMNAIEKELAKLNAHRNADR